MRLTIQHISTEDARAIADRLETMETGARNALDILAQSTLATASAQGGEAGAISAAADHVRLCEVIDWTHHLIEEAEKGGEQFTAAVSHLLGRVTDSHDNRSMSRSTSVAHNLTRDIKREALIEVLDAIGGIR